MAVPLLTISDLSIGFKEDLVRDISLEVHSGEIIAVLGPSGIGKTTLVRTIAGLVRPRQGSFELNLPAQGGLGYIPQRLGLVRHASVYHNVNLGARASLPVLKGKREERIETRQIGYFCPWPERQNPRADSSLIGWTTTQGCNSSCSGTTAKIIVG